MVSYMCGRRFLIFSVIVIASTLCLAKGYEVHGFVTSANSPTSFAIVDYKITRDNTAISQEDQLPGEPKPKLRPHTQKELEQAILKMLDLTKMPAEQAYREIERLVPQDKGPRQNG